MMKNILIFLAGGLVVFVVLKYLYKAKQPQAEESNISSDVKAIVQTEQAQNLLMSEEFKALMKTPEFKQLIKDYGAVALAEILTV